MMRAAREGAPNAELYAVTVLTSLSEELVTTVYNRSVKEEVLTLAKLAKEAQMNGVVCSPQEVSMLSKRPELNGLKFITPGVRSIGFDTHDQKRVATPIEALRDGATHLVIGRQITKAADPFLALQALENEITASPAIHS